MFYCIVCFNILLIIYKSMSMRSCLLSLQYMLCIYTHTHTSEFILKMALKSRSMSLKGVYSLN